MDHIRLLCRSGAGLQAIVGPLCHAVRDLIAAAGAAMFWLDGVDLLPAGFYHDSAPAELKDFFIAKLEELFIDPAEITSVSLINGDGPLIGKMLRPGETERFWRGKIYQYLCAPLDHHHMLDMALRRHGQGAALFVAWNPRDRPFTRAHATMLEPVHRLIEQALASDGAQTSWIAQDTGQGHFITDLTGRDLIAVHPDAERMLMDSHLLRQRVSMTTPTDIAPAFAAQLAAELANGSAAVMHLPVANGRLVARASRTRLVNAEQSLMYVALHREVARNVLAVEYVMRLPLTALQREIALFAMTGGQRSDCAAEFGVSDEALKKHLRPIFSATATGRWADLAGHGLV